MGFLLTFFDLFFSLLTLAIVARALLSWVPIDRYNPIVTILYQITEPILAPLRRYIPPIGGMMDITPIVALIILQVIQAIIHNLIVGAYYR